MTEVILRPVRDGFGNADTFDVVDPETGELLDPREPHVLAAALEAARQEETRLATFKRYANRTIDEWHSERGEKRTFMLPDGTRLVREGGPEKVYDAGAIERELRAAGMPDDRVREVVVTTIVKTVSGKEARAVSAANPEYAAIIERHTSMVEKPYRYRPAS